MKLEERTEGNEIDDTEATIRKMEKMEQYVQLPEFLSDKKTTSKGYQQIISR